MCECSLEPFNKHLITVERRKEEEEMREEGRGERKRVREERVRRQSEGKGPHQGRS